jgi:hypothetical protein
MLKNQHHDLGQFRCSLQSHASSSSPMPQFTPDRQSRQDKEDLGSLIARERIEDWLFEAQRLPAILCHTEKLGEQFEKDIG